MTTTTTAATRRPQSLRLNPIRVRRARTDLGLSQSKVGKAIGVSQRVVSSWERGDRQPSTLDEMTNLARTLGHDLDELVLADGERPPTRAEVYVAEIIGELPDLDDGTIAAVRDVMIEARRRGARAVAAAESEVA